MPGNAGGPTWREPVLKVRMAIPEVLVPKAGDVYVATPVSHQSERGVLCCPSAVRGKAEQRCRPPMTLQTSQTVEKMWWAARKARRCRVTSGFGGTDRPRLMIGLTAADAPQVICTRPSQWPDGQEAHRRNGILSQESPGAEPAGDTQSWWDGLEEVEGPWPGAA